MPEIAATTYRIACAGLFFAALLLCSAVVMPVAAIGYTIGSTRKFYRALKNGARPSYATALAALGSQPESGE